MKRILLSAGMIAVVGALAVGGTIAFYNDTETSTGNIFTAGSIDLTVDHTRASYNGEECETCHLEIVSDSTTVVGSSPAVVLSFVHRKPQERREGGVEKPDRMRKTDFVEYFYLRPLAHADCGRRPFPDAVNRKYRRLFVGRA